LGFQFFPPLFFSNGRLHSPFLVCLTTSIIGSFLKGLLCIIAKQTERFSNVDFAFDFASCERNCSWGSINSPPWRRPTLLLLFNRQQHFSSYLCVSYSMFPIYTANIPEMNTSYLLSFPSCIFARIFPFFLSRRLDAKKLVIKINTKSRLLISWRGWHIWLRRNSATFLYFLHLHYLFFLFWLFFLYISRL
jgi:hypothetical protein